MATTMAGSERLKADVNITPLIDVLLVLLIIFMVITPVAPKGTDVVAPQPRMDDPGPPPARTVVIQVEAPGKLFINQEAVTEPELGPRLLEIFKIRAEKVCFVKGASGLDFQQVARVIDIAKSAGVDKVGLLTPHTSKTL